MQLASAARRKHFNLMDSNFTAIEAEAMNEANTKQATVYIYISFSLAETCHEMS
jgi:hypothetical protein